MRKQILIMIFLIISLLFQLNLSVTATPFNLTQTEDIELLDFEMQIENENNLFSKIDINAGSPPQIQNRTKARFVGTLVNQDTENLVIHSFVVNIFNQTNQSVPFLKFEHSFQSTTNSEEILLPNSVKTQSLDDELVFEELEVRYTIQIAFIYNKVSNSSLILTAASSQNFTVSVLPSIANPPEFLIIIWYGITIFVVIYSVSMIWYGRRIKNKKR